MFNHSCAPNAVVSFVGGRLRVRAIQAVAEGDEVCIAYTELYATADARRVSQS
jgi:SET and MYND domain-containing protein